MKDMVLEDIKNYIYAFANQINQGFGYIAKSDIMRQFYEMFPNFENKIFNEENLEKFIIEELSFIVKIEYNE